MSIFAELMHHVKIPELVQLICTFLPFWALRLTPETEHWVFTEATDKFKLRVPNNMFHSIVWMNRTCPDFRGGVRLEALRQLKRGNIGHVLVDIFDEHFQMASHTECCRAFRKWFRKNSEDITQSQQEFMDSHWASFWLKRIHLALQLPYETVLHEGIDIVAIYMLKASLHSKESVAQATRDFLADIIPLKL